MAGGSGERFWPLSRTKRPKQLLKLTSDKETLLEEAVNRILALIPAKDVYVATSRTLAPAIAKAGLKIPRRNILAEPMKRNTTGCLCWVASELSARFPKEDPAIAILTADHMIGQTPKFLACVKRALDTAEKHDALVTIGIKPTRPETGYGYIETKKRKRGDDGPIRVERFREKPSLEQAEDFLASGNYTWNSGMFFWRLSTFQNELDAASPVAGETTRQMMTLLKGNKPRAAEMVFANLPDISIDYSLLEKSRHVMMVESTFPWDDVGAWDALERSRERDKEGNVTSGAPVLLETRDSIVLNEAPGRIAVGVVGMVNVVVIVSDDSVLVVPKEKAQEVRLVARELKKRGAKQV
ncbi:mannose-1-phosphate guanylyltransferase [Candidatus Sumerlaeota bacterium]|nr:mannose-1-phosphate guanylyltransferase [Candidatus Sumerlaeota bacterium]